MGGLKYTGISTGGQMRRRGAGSCHVLYTGGMDTLLRILNRPVIIKPAGPGARRVLYALLVGWVVLNGADWLTTAAALTHAGIQEDNPLQAALLAHGGLAAPAVYKVLVIARGAALTWLGFRMWPRFFVALMGVCDLLAVAAVANNVFWLVRRWQPFR
jgi:hypothetical protein